MSRRTYALMTVLAVLLLAVVATTMVMAQGPPDGDGIGPVGVVNVDKVQEDVVRSLLEENGKVVNPDRQLARVAMEQEGGFGGFYFDETDESIAYVYMKDPSKVEAAKAAFRIAYAGGQRQITQIVPVQGDYSFDDLVRWYYALDKALVEGDIHTTSGAVQEIDNRIAFGVQDVSQIEEARRIMGELGIPEGSVVFRLEKIELLANGDSTTAKWRPVVGGIQ